MVPLLSMSSASVLSLGEADGKPRDVKLGRLDNSGHKNGLNSYLGAGKGPVCAVPYCVLVPLAPRALECSLDTASISGNSLSKLGEAM